MYVSGSSEKNFNITKATQWLVIFTAANSSAHGLAIVNATSSGTIVITKIHMGANIDISSSNINILKVTNNYGNALSVTFLRTTSSGEVTESVE